MPAGDRRLRAPGRSEVPETPVDRPWSLRIAALAAYPTDSLANGGDGPKAAPEATVLGRKERPHPVYGRGRGRMERSVLR